MSILFRLAKNKNVNCVCVCHQRWTDVDDTQMIVSRPLISGWKVGGSWLKTRQGLTLDRITSSPIFRPEEAKTKKWEEVKRVNGGTSTLWKVKRKIFVLFFFFCFFLFEVRTENIKKSFSIPTFTRSPRHRYADNGKIGKKKKWREIWKLGGKRKIENSGDEMWISRE